MDSPLKWSGTDLANKNIHTYTVHFGIDTITNLGPNLWKLVLDEIKKASPLSIFKSRIKTWITNKYTCRLCKTFVKDHGLVKSVPVSNGIHNIYLQYMTIGRIQLLHLH